ncbi:MAG: cytochrome c4, partial [Thiomargarita sp.]|nr:cytochrome c4 [Thiomargarita sp.]
GNSFVPTFPKLAGQHPNYIIQQLENFKNGTRTDPVMAPMSMALTEEDRQNLAAYFSSQTIKPSPVVENSAKQGEKLYLGGNTVAGVPACSGCHGPQGKGNPASNYPAIGGQHGAYAKKQLNDYKNKTRTADNASIMTDIATKMTTGEIEAVTNYLQSLQ